MAEEKHDESLSDEAEWSDDGVSSENEKVEESDSSEDEVAPRNTVGDIPLVEWHKDEEHIGYDIKGKKLKKQPRKDKLASFLEGADDPKNWRKIYDEYNDEEVELTRDDIRLIQRLISGRTPHAEVNPYEDYVDWFEYEDKGHPLSNAPEPKRRFVPSKWEAKKVAALVRKIRAGLIKAPDEPKEEEANYYLLWGDDTNSAENKKRINYIPAPKLKLPGHEESYNPSVEYIPTEEEINSYQLMYEEDRPKFIPRRYLSLRSVPAYDKSVKEMFDRCLDQYLCPRTRKKRINIDPESLKPKLPSRKDLRPYPTTCYLEYLGHAGPVNCISVDPSGQWLASGSTDGTTRMWEIETGRCLKVWEIGEAARQISWNPVADRPILAVVLEYDVLLLNSGMGDIDIQTKTKELLHVSEPGATEDAAVSWMQHEKHDGIRIKHFKAVSSIEWHSKGDYFTTVVPTFKRDSRAVLVHQLSKKNSDKPFRKLPGIPVTAVFHPSKKIFFVATKRFVQVYDLSKGQRIKKLETGVREISSISVHPGGDNLIVGSKEGKMCWFDLDLSTRPYKTLKAHSKDITRVTFHRTYPLFASASDDCTAYVFHSTVYSDLNQNPLIVPLEILRGHKAEHGRGVLDCKYHPRQPWLFTAGADSTIKLYCH
ncbi:ribosome biogenesis protein BOP1 isoform X1 [Carex littledalei]|uniref:Ribosome biogenesis protein BOP1 homolog n=1 Tax=Carex littledalei TaxID=544730 RepID=A0A833VL60_9POAL|nr:ribosome biogenesis protein BOP1 isoform X1 [Carex littledalei]